MSVAIKADETSLYDVKLCYPFIAAVCEILVKQCNIGAQMGPVEFKDESLEKTDLAIVATLSSETTIATISICFPQKTILGIVNKMLGESYTQITSDVEDAAKELANMFFNQAKQRLVKKGVSAVRSIPQLIIGAGTKLRYLTRGRTVTLLITTDVGLAMIEVTSQDRTVSDMI